MQKLDFEEAVDSILEKDSRYAGDAYLFLRDALDFTIQELHDAGTVESRHVSGPELLEGFRKYALQEFGPMVLTVLGEWGIHSCEGVGEMVFKLIESGAFGKTDDDSKEDFKDVYDFHEAFAKPYEPKGGGDCAPDVVREHRAGGASLEQKQSK